MAAPGVEAAEDVGLVAELERLDRARRHPRQQLSRLGHGHLHAVGPEVDAHDQAGVHRLRERAGDGGPTRSQRLSHAARMAHAGHRPPPPIGGVAPDSHLRRLPRRKVAHQLLEHRVDRARIAAGVAPHRLVLDPHAEESGATLCGHLVRGNSSMMLPKGSATLGSVVAESVAGRCRAAGPALTAALEGETRVSSPATATTTSNTTPQTNRQRSSDILGSLRKSRDQRCTDSRLICRPTRPPWPAVAPWRRGRAERSRRG